MHDARRTINGLDFDREVAPWNSAPYSLITWWDMESFSAQDFCILYSLLESMQTVFKVRKDEFDLDAAREHIGLLLMGAEKEARALGLRMSLTKIEDVNTRLNQYSEDQIRSGISEICNRLKDEMKIELFLHVASADAKLYQAESPLFGDRVHDRFQSAEHDIREAGKCFALERNTACVLHLMRVLEIGLRTLAGSLNIRFGHGTWHVIIQKAESELSRIQAKKRKPKDWQQQRQFVSEALIHFRLLKDAWRNYAMHVHTRFERDQVRDIYNSVEAFMRHLANRLRE